MSQSKKKGLELTIHEILNDIVELVVSRDGDRYGNSGADTSPNKTRNNDEFVPDRLGGQG